MRRYLLLSIAFAASIALSACSNTPDSTNEATVEKEENAAAPAFDTTTPASYDDYKRWRAANDPAGQYYADYKAWYIAYQKWLKEQQSGDRSQ